MQMAQESIKQTSTLPIPKKAVRLGITKARNTYRNTVYESQWALLAKVYFLQNDFQRIPFIEIIKRLFEIKRTIRCSNVYIYKLRKSHRFHLNMFIVQIH